MAVQSAVSGARSTLGSTRKHWKFGLLKSPAAMWAMPLCCPNCSARYLPITRLPASLPPLMVCRQTVAGQRTEPTTRPSATMRLPNAVLPPSFHLARTPSRGRPIAPGQPRATKPFGHRNISDGTLATMERLPPPEPCRDENALCKTAGSAPHGAGLRPPGRGVPGSCCCAEQLHRARHPGYEGRRIGRSRDSGSPTVSRFVQQNPQHRKGSFCTLERLCCTNPVRDSSHDIQRDSWMS